MKNDLVPTTFQYVKDLHTEIRELREYRDNFLVIEEMGRVIKEHEDALVKYPNKNEIKHRLEAFYTVRKFYEELNK